MKVERLIVIFIGTLIGAMLLTFNTAHGQINKVFPNAQSVGSPREIHVDNNGNIRVEGLYVEQIAGTTFFTKLYWDDIFLRINVRADARTKLTKRFGSSANMGDIAEGHYITAEGKILGGSGSLDFQATSVKDWSLNTDEGVAYSGTIIAVGPAADTMTLKAKDGSVITLKMTGATVITKGLLTIPMSGVKRNDTILEARGTYDYITKTLTTFTLNVYQDKSIFESKLYTGKLKSIAGTTLPTSIVVTSEGKDYTVYLNASADVLNNKRQTVSLQRYVVGDSVRLTGKLRQANLSEIDANVVRNTDL